MKRLFLMIALIVGGTTMLKADFMNDLLSSQKYAPKRLNKAYMDSVLNKPSDEGRYTLKYKNKQQQYRYSFFADYYLHDNKKDVDIRLSDTLLREAKVSPNGKYIAYGKGQDLYLYKVDFKTEVAVSDRRDKDIFSGLSDWLYEEEFGITRMFAFSPDSKQLAFIQLDETDVPSFTWQTFLNPDAEDATPIYPQSHSIRYPRVGEKNAVAKVYVYDIHDKSLQLLKLPHNESQYIPRLRWRQDPATISKKNDKEIAYTLIVETLNREQNELTLYECNPKSTVCHPLYREETSDYYIDYSLIDQWQWLNDGNIIVLSEKDGYRRLYLYSAKGTPIRALSPDGIDVTTVYGVNEKTGMLYFQAAVLPTERQVFASTLKTGIATPLTNEHGFNSMYFAKDYSQCILIFESDITPPQYTLYSLNKDKLKVVKSLENNAVLAAKWKSLGMPQKQFVRIPTERGDSLDAWILKPNNITKPCPVVIAQYSGPSSQRVLNRWSHRFAYVLAQEGYIVVNADPRGTDCRGRQWRNETYMQLGKKEAEDQLSVAKYMQQMSDVDSRHIGMIGWSYGGYQTIRTMCEQDSQNPLICCGVAIAPVTDWSLYDSGYTERYMHLMSYNDRGFHKSSLNEMADRLSGRLLLVHGLADDNVHVQNTWLLTEALVNAGKQFDMQIYPDDNHNLRKGNHYMHLHQLILRFLKQHLYD